jgi:hypothetical protein
MAVWFSYTLPGDDTLTFYQSDLTVRESVKRPASATQWPIEDGASISDHVKIDSVNLMLEGFISDTPIRKETSYPVVSSGLTRSQQAHDKIVELQKAKVIVEVFTDAAIYETMLVETVTHDKNKSKRGGLWLVVQLREARLVSAQDVRIKDSPAPIKVPPVGDLSIATVRANLYVVSREQKINAGKAIQKNIEDTARTAERTAEYRKTKTMIQIENLDAKFLAEDLAEGRL